MALSAGTLLHQLEAHLLASGGDPVATGRVWVFPGDARGLLRRDLAYPGGHVLVTFIYVTVEDGSPAWLTYRFHLRDADGRCVFRYDNAPHYPEMATFPDHTHVGPDERPVEHPRPSLRQILDEVARETGASRIDESGSASGAPDRAG